MPRLLDPCEEAVRLRNLYTLIVTGEQPEGVRFSDEEIRYGKADLTRLERMIADADRACAIANGGSVKPRRYARRVSFG